MRPALVWGWTRYPSRSRAAMSLRTVAGEAPTLPSRTTWLDPTGWAVSMYSSTMALRMAALRSSSICVWHSIVPSASRVRPDRLRFGRASAALLGDLAHVLGADRAEHLDDVGGQPTGHVGQHAGDVVGLALDHVEQLLAARLAEPVPRLPPRRGRAGDDRHRVEEPVRDDCRAGIGGAVDAGHVLFIGISGRGLKTQTCRPTQAPALSSSRSVHHSAPVSLTRQAWSNGGSARLRGG